MTLDKNQRLQLARDLREVEALHTKDPTDYALTAGICYAVGYLREFSQPCAYALVDEALDLVQSGWRVGYSDRLCHYGPETWAQTRPIMCLLMAHWLEDNVTP